jgi:predicted dehydrogenase
MVLRGGIIGAGNVALNGHLPAFRDDPWLKERVELVAAADLSPANLDALRARLPGARGYPSAAAMLADGGLDFVDVCAPPGSRVEHIGAAIDAGCHVVCEKPLARTLAEGLAIARGLAGKPLVFAPCHQYRFSPLWQAVGETLASGALGDVHVVRFDVLRPRADSGNPHWQAGWRRDPAMAGGGIVFDIGIHYFYLVCALFGRPRTVTARIARLSHRGDEVEDTALIVLEYPATLLQLNLSWAADRRENGLRLVGTHGRLELLGDRLVLERGVERREWDFTGALAKSAYPRWYAALFRGFVADVAAKRCAAEPLAEALDTLRLADLAYRSAETGRALAFGDDGG